MLERLPKEKRDAVLNAGFEQFAQGGYRKTSMADIAAAAGVSKAALFHYFGSKKEMYLYLYSLGVAVVTSAIVKASAQPSNDFFERMALAQQVKLDVVLQYRGMYDFFAASVAENDPEVSAEVGARNEEYIKQGFDSIFEGVDWSRFKPGVDRQMVVNMVTWMSEGFIRTVDMHLPCEALSRQSLEYMNLIKSCVYKEEYL